MKNDLYIAIGDLHLGYKNDDEFIRKYQTKMFNQLFTFIETNKIKNFIQAGDWYTDMKIPSTYTIKFSNWLIDNLFSSGIENIYHLDGNHDKASKNDHITSSFDEIHGYREGIISITDQIYSINDNIVLMPYPTGEIIDKFVQFYGKLKTSDEKILISHLDVIGFKMNNFRVSDFGFDPKKLKKFKHIYFGHYHLPSNEGNITSLGSFCELNWNDYNVDHGFLILNGEGDLIDKFIFKDSRIFEKYKYIDSKIIRIRDNCEIEQNNIKNQFVKIYANDFDTTTSKFLDIKNTINNNNKNLDIIDRRTIELNHQDESANANIVNVDEIIGEYISDFVIKNEIENPEIAEAISNRFMALYDNYKANNNKNSSNKSSITFLKIKFKNFYSYGDEFVEFDLNSKKSTLIYGENGAGKTTILEAIFVGLYGKSYRDVNKNQMINDINNSGMEVELIFYVGGNSYKIHRGIKPEIFDIYIDGELYTKGTSALDKQKFLDDMIIDSGQMKQTNLVSMFDYIPFLKMKAPLRRSYLEEYFEFEVFNYMIKQARSEFNSLKSEIERFDNQIQNLISQNNIYIGNIKSFEQVNNQELEKYDIMIDEINTNINNNKASRDILMKEVLACTITDLDATLSEANNYFNEINTKINKINYKYDDNLKLVKFYNENNECKVCKQLIDDKFKFDEIERLELHNTKLAEADVLLRQNLSKYYENYNNMLKTKDTVNELKRRIVNLENSINIDEVMLSKTESNKRTLESRISSGIKDIQDKIDNINKQINSIKTNSEQANKDKLVMDYLISMLDDRKGVGIKNIIIQNWINYIEISTNKYLEMMQSGFIVKLDNNFDITSYPKERTYRSLSGGQRQRLDMAIKFTFDDIASIKNRESSSNLKFYDEIFDSSLDANAISGIMTILDLMVRSGKTCFTISHKESIAHLFEQSIKVELDTFSKLVYNG